MSYGKYPSPRLESSSRRHRSATRKQKLSQPFSSLVQAEEETLGDQVEEEVVEEDTVEEEEEVSHRFLFEPSHKSRQLTFFFVCVFFL